MSVFTHSGTFVWKVVPLLPVRCSLLRNATCALAPEMARLLLQELHVLIIFSRGAFDLARPAHRVPRYFRCFMDAHESSFAPFALRRTRISAFLPAQAPHAQLVARSEAASSLRERRCAGTSKGLQAGEPFHECERRMQTRCQRHQVRPASMSLAA